MSLYHKIAAANSTISTTDIKGKEYAQVNERIKAFRMVYPDGAIITTLESDSNGKCVIKASVYASADAEFAKPLGTGYAYERESSSYINKTSYIENCETSAVGRALAMCGFGIDISIASCEELKTAMRTQYILEHKDETASEEEIKQLIDLAAKKGIKKEQLLKRAGVDKAEDLTYGMLSDLAKAVDKSKGGEQ